MAGGESYDTQGYKIPPSDDQEHPVERRSADQPASQVGLGLSAKWPGLDEGRGGTMRTAGEMDLKPGSDPFASPNQESRMIRRLSAGDEEALGALMDRYGGALLHFAHRLVGDMQMAEEICQDTMLKAWQQAGSFRMDGHLKAWLFRVARNNAIDYIRRKRLPTEEFQAAHDQASSEQQPEREAEKSWLTDAIFEALDALPEQYREVIEMRFFQDMCYQEIAESLKIPLGTVKSRLNYALKGLTRVLTERGISPDLLDP